MQKIIHNGERESCPEAPRTEKTRWTSDRELVTCPVCKPKA